jgi:hypothetical protein
VKAASDGWTAERAYDAVRAVAGEALADGGRFPEPPSVSDGRLRSALAPDDRPRLTESWFCCAEPTDAQFRALDVDMASPAGGS